jgi:hypothetical protein
MLSNLRPDSRARYSGHPQEGWLSPRSEYNLLQTRVSRLPVAISHHRFEQASAGNPACCVLGLRLGDHTRTALLPNSVFGDMFGFGLRAALADEPSL